MPPSVASTIVLSVTMLFRQASEMPSAMMYSGRPAGPSSLLRAIAPVHTWSSP